jgi:dTDP-glucose 4,6-dehydratase
VTGASGFIGGAVARRLALAGATVHAAGCTRPPPPGLIGHRAHLPEDAAQLVHQTRPEVVLHLASPVSMGAGPEVLEALRPGIVEATRAIAEACTESGARLIHISSCAVYEGSQAPFAESTALAPISPYAHLKLEAEEAVHAQVRVGLEATILRPFRTYGPGCETGLIAEACRAALGPDPLQLTAGVQVREWNHVDMVAQAIIAAAAQDGDGSTWNIGGGSHLSVLDLARKIFALAGRPESQIQVGSRPARPGDPQQFWGDHRRTRARFGPAPQLSLSEGLIQTLAWHRARLRSAT